MERLKKLSPAYSQLMFEDFLDKHLYIWGMSY